MPKRQTPENTFWRGAVLWGRIEVDSREIRWSLRTGDARLAAKLVADRRKQEIADRYHGAKRTTYDEAFARWSVHIGQQIGPATAKRYAVSLHQLSGFLRPLYVDQIDRAIVSEIVDARRRAKVSTATIRRDLTALSSVLAYAEDEGWREGNPALDRMRRLTERREPIALPEAADIERVIARAPGNLAHLIRAAWLTGCRQEELVSADRRAFDQNRRTLTVIGKGRKLRVIPLSQEAHTALRAIPASLSTERLFWHHGRPYANVASRFVQIMESARNPAQFRRFRFHDLRHRFAVDYLRAGGSIYALQKILGHTSVKTTEIYLAYLTPDEAEGAKVGTISGTSK
jgi:integrase/recombinase XerD